MILDPVIRKRLVALAGCAAKNSARPALSALAFDRTQVWATDKYVLGRIDIPGRNGPGPRRVIAAAELAKLLRATKADDDVTLDFGDERAKLIVSTEALFGGSRRTVTFAYADGYPAADKMAALIPAERGCTDTVPPPFNPARLAQVAALATDGFVQLHWSDEKTVVVVTGTDGVFLGLVKAMSNAPAWKPAEAAVASKVSA